MPATETDLIAAIVADPGDRDARQVYADWLARAGDPRGELMHLELARAQMLEGDDNYDVIVARIVALAAELFTPVLTPLWRLQIPDVRFNLHRGLPAVVSGTVEAVAAASVRLAANAPLVTRLDVAMQTSLKALAPTGLLERATELRIGARTFEARCLHVLGDERPALRELFLRGAIRPQTLAWLGDAELPRLERLELGGSFGPARIRRGTPSQGFTALEPLVSIRCPLRELVIPGARLGAQLGEIIGAMTCPLTHLRISGNELGRAGVEGLLPALGSVERLDLADNELTYDALGPLLAALPRCRVLRLAHNPLGDHGAELIAEWEGASHLHTLDLGNTGVTERGALALARSSRFANLRLLRLEGPPFEGAARRALARSKHLPLARIYAGNLLLDRSPSKSKRHRGA